MNILKILRFRDKQVSRSTQTTRAQKKQSETMLDRFASYTIIFGVFSLPLFFIPFPEVSLAFGKSLFLAFIVMVAFLLWVIARLKEGTIRFPWSGILLAFGGVVFVSFVSALFSPVIRESLTGFSYELGTAVSFLILFLLLFLVSVLFQTERRILELYSAIIFSFFLVFLFHATRLFLGADFFSFGIFTNGTSIVGKWNDISIFAGLVVLLSLPALEFVPLRPRMRWLLIVSLVVALLSLAIVNFYLSWILIGALALIVFIYRLSISRFTALVRGEEATRFPFSSLSVLVVASLFIIAGGTLSGYITSFTNTTSLEVRPSWSSTIEITKETLKDSPLLGAGPNRFVEQWLLHKPEAINTTFFWNTDFRTGVGLIPTFTTTTGIIGLLAWLIFFGVFLQRGFRSLFAFTNPVSHYIVFSSFVGALYLWTLTVFYIPNLPMFALAFLFSGVFVAFLVRRGLVREISFSYIKDPRVGFVSVLTLVMLFIGGIAGGYSIVQKFSSIKNFHDSRVALASGNVDEARADIVRALDKNPNDTLYRSLADIEVVNLSRILGQQDVSADNVRADFQATLGNAITAGQQAVRLDNTDYLNWQKLSEVYTSVIQLKVSGAYENAVQSLDEAKKRNPQSPAILLRRAQIEASRGDGEKAREFISKALQLKNNYTDAIFLLAQIQINEGDVDQAIRSVEQASLIEPNNSGLFFRLGLLKYSDNDYAGAASAFERAVTISPSYANARYFLGLSHYNIGNTERAIAEFERIQKDNAGNEEVKKILLNLKRGRSPFAKFTPIPTPPEERGEPPIEE